MLSSGFINFPQGPLCELEYCVFEIRAAAWRVRPTLESPLFIRSPSSPHSFVGGMMIVPLVIILTCFRRTWCLSRGLVDISFAAMILLALIGLAAVLFCGGFVIGF
ncbi:hypothetical protein AAur_pTC10148 (plasmid) [Paenarthrobacter aurescens TC1]|nr:hypothetical protein AAur_pTC10148 [Paenarthrobacter aurescens TC1]